ARAYARVTDFVGLPEPSLDPRSVHFTSVMRFADGTYCLFLDQSLGRPSQYLPVVSPSVFGDAAFASVGLCEYMGIEGIGVNTFNSSGQPINHPFTVLVP